AAGNVVGRKYPVADLEVFDAAANFYDFSGDLMADDDRRFLDPIPFHHIPAADAARARLNEQFVWTNLWHRHLLKPHIAVVVVHSDAHRGTGSQAIWSLEAFLNKG